MIAITAIVRVKKGCEGAMRDALLTVVDNVKRDEPGTLGYFVGQDPQDPCVFTTYERYVDQGAMDRHNNSDTVARFFEIAKPLLDGDVTLVITNELFVKS